MDNTMREMKDSGISWVGNIPSDWKVKRGKYIFQYIQKPVRQDDEVITCFRDGEVTLRSNRREDGFTMSEKEIGYQGIDVGDLVIHGMDGFAGSIGISDSRGKASPVLNVLDTKEDKKYFMYYLRSAAWAGLFVSLATGIRVRTCDTNWGKLREIFYLLPDRKEQTKIAKYLDSRCSEIDDLITDIQKEIEILEAYKQSVITETVTKGLDKNASMKDSGIDWLGYIPEKWKIRRGKYIFEQRSDKGNNKSLVLLSPTQNYGVIPQELYEELSGFSAVKLNEKTDLNSLKTVHKGAFVISLRSFQGGFEYSEYEGVVSPAYQVFYPTMQVCDGYYKYLFKTQVFIDKMNSYTMSLRDGKNIAFADFGRTYIPIPPISEQKDITEMLDKTCAELNIILEEKNQQINILNEYKKSVIYEYVTGKKGVLDGEF